MTFLKVGGGGRALIRSEIFSINIVRKYKFQRILMKICKKRKQNTVAMNVGFDRFSHLNSIRIVVQTNKLVNMYSFAVIFFCHFSNNL